MDTCGYLNALIVLLRDHWYKLNVFKAYNFESFDTGLYVQNHHNKNNEHIHHTQKDVYGIFSSFDNNSRFH
jgi:hypothetical protein